MRKIKEIINRIDRLDCQLMKKTQCKLNNLTKPPGSLGQLEEVAKLIVGITKKEKPILRKKVIFTLVADHGVTEEGVSAYPKEVTLQMVYNFLKGGAAINVLARHVGARVCVVDVGVAKKLKIKNEKLKIKKINYGTRNMTKEPAMSRSEATRSIEAGIEVFKEELSKGIDLAATGDMGIGNTTASSAIVAAITGEAVEKVTGRGTGINNETLKNKIKIIKKALEINKPNRKDPIDVLSKVGGFEIGGLAGIILASASQSIPIVIDGFISGAAALIAYQLEPKIKDYLIASHCSVERGHKITLRFMGLKPLLDLELRLGEGTGAALGINLIEASIKILTEMATFEDAGVTKRID
jgi:nicotinate-nucleotide--dimethylbenzimidazole phosphoribosyltransferase